MKLDKYQKKVIKTKAKNTLVIAGAGSGKTLTIIYKIKALIEKGLKEREILCITFTKASASSLKEKLSKENINLNVKTFHSLGYQIINQTQKVNLVNENKLDEIIENHINKYKSLNKLINAPFIEIGKTNFNIMQDAILKNSYYKAHLKNTLKTFINLFKSSCYSPSSFDEFLKINNQNNAGKKRIRHKMFIKLVKRIYIKYEEYLENTNQIDYHDMINKARIIVKKEGIYPYKYIIIDEYQDTSLNKCELIKEIQNKTNANLLAVGDDWQSIYRFTGSNLEIFTKFKKHFKNAKIIKLKKTYRNSNELLKITRKFITKNPCQIDKKISSNLNLKKPIYIFYYEKNIKEVWEKICKITKEQTYILGRNNKDITKIPYIKKNMKFMTAHSSKGLEAEKVIILNLENTITGFPSKIKDSDYLKYVIPKEDDFPFAEERRLFYVALTRTKNKIILLVNKENPSQFVTELLKDFPKYITEIDN